MLLANMNHCTAIKEKKEFSLTLLECSDAAEGRGI